MSNPYKISVHKESKGRFSLCRKGKQWSFRVKDIAFLLNTPREVCISIPRAYISPNLCSLIIIFVIVCLVSCPLFYAQQWETLFLLLKTGRIAPWETSVLVLSACSGVVQAKLVTLHCQWPLSYFNGLSLWVAWKK